MQISRLLISATTWIVFVSFGAQVMAQDWPQWRGPNRDGKATGFTAPQTWPKALSEKWKLTVGQGDATPALVGDKLYVFARQGTDEVTLCLNAADSKEIWRDKYPAPAFGGPDSGQHMGPRSSPAVAEGKVATLGVLGVLSCLDAASGKVLWRNDKYTAVPRFHTAMSPIITDGMVIAHLGGENNGALIAFDATTGAEKWKWTAEGPHYASPTLMSVDGTKSIVTLNAKSAVGVALADGKLLWQVPFAPAGMAYNAATPIVDGSTVIITGGGRGTRAYKIEKQGDAFAANQLWTSAQPAPQFNNPVLKDGFLYGLSNQSKLYCIDIKDGKTAWTDAASHGQRGFGSIVDAGSVLLALGNDGELVAFKPDGKAYSEAAKIKVAATQTYAHPVVSGNRIFVKDQTSLAMLVIE